MVIHKFCSGIDFQITISSANKQEHSGSAVQGEKDGEEIFDTGKLLPILKAAVSLCYRPSQYLVEEPDIGRRNRDPFSRENA